MMVSELTLAEFAEIYEKAYGKEAPRGMSDLARKVRYEQLVAAKVAEKHRAREGKI